MEYIGKHAKLENVMRPLSGACFHGECWYKCPRCKYNFEFWDTVYERGFKHIRDKVYQHVTDGCGQLINMN